MADYNFDAVKKDVTRRMDGAIDVLGKEFGGLRTGRASVSLLEPLVVDAYGSQMPISQLGNVAVPEPRMLSVQVWDKDLIKTVEKAIRDSDLGLNPSVDGQLVRVPIPPLSEERRAELTKVAGRYAEEARVAVRNVRRHTMDDLKKQEKCGAISQDQHRDYGIEIQELTDGIINKMDTALSVKEEEIMQV